MRIGFFTDTYTSQVNGVVSSIDHTRRALEAMGHTVFVFAPALPNRALRRGEKQNVLHVRARQERHVFRFPSTSFVYGWFYPEMRMPLLPVRVSFWKKLLNLKLDIVHSHDPLNMGIFAEFFAKYFDIPHVHTYHTVFSDYVHHIPGHKVLPAAAAVERYSAFFCNACDGIVAPSQKIVNFLKKCRVRVPIQVIPNGVQTALFEHSGRAFLRSRLGIPHSTRILLYVGRFSPEKNVRFLIDAMPAIFAQTTDTVLVLVGTGPQEKVLRAHVAKLGIKDRVFFAGVFPYEKMPRVFADGDLFVFPSLSENNPMVILEALTTGLPIVTPRDLAYDGFVINGVTGYQTAPDPSAYAKTVVDLLSDPAQMAVFARAAQAHGKTYDSRFTAEKLVGFYERLIFARRKF